MIDLLNTKLMENLNVVQSKLSNVSNNYHIPNVSDFSCVRCSGSAGRYVYEKQGDKKTTASKEEAGCRRPEGESRICQK